MRELMMNKALEFIRSLWIKAQLEASSFVEATVLPRLYEAKDVALLLMRPYLPVYQLQGQGRGGSLTVAYIGLSYTKPFWTGLLFEEAPIERQVGRIPLWRYDEIANLPSDDLIIVEAVKHLIRRLPHDNAIVMPQLVEHVLNVQGDWQDVRRRLRTSVRRNELRLVRKYGYEYDVSHSSQDFEEFYRQMYLPTVQERYDELAVPVSIGEAYQYFRHGCLFRVKRDGIWVSGMVCYFQQGIVYAKMAGVRDGDERLIHEGATSTLYYAAIHWANQHGYKAVNFLVSGARLESGLFQHKRKWGTSVRVSPKLHRQIWIKVQRVTPAVSQFLKENPFVVIDEDGKLHGLIVVDDTHNVPAETRGEWEGRYITPGLSSLLVHSVSNFADSSANVSAPDLVISISPRPGLGDGQ